MLPEPVPGSQFLLKREAKINRAMSYSITILAIFPPPLNHPTLLLPKLAA